jgi:hypothetical protein
LAVAQTAAQQYYTTEFALNADITEEGLLLKKLTHNFSSEVISDSLQTKFKLPPYGKIVKNQL